MEQCCWPWIIKNTSYVHNLCSEENCLAFMKQSNLCWGPKLLLGLVWEGTGQGGRVSSVSVKSNKCKSCWHKLSSHTFHRVWKHFLVRHFICIEANKQKKYHWKSIPRPGWKWKLSTSSTDHIHWDTPLLHGPDQSPWESYKDAGSWAFCTSNLGAGCRWGFRASQMKDEIFCCEFHQIRDDQLKKTNIDDL